MSMPSTPMVMVSGRRLSWLHHFAHECSVFVLLRAVSWGVLWKAEDLRETSAHVEFC